MGQELLESIKIALLDFSNRPLEEAAASLWRCLGYESSRTAGGIRSLDDLPGSERMADLKEQTRRFRLLFQLTADEIRLVGQPSLSLDTGRYQNQILESYVFTAVELEAKPYTRTELATFARALNRAFPMPVMVTFKHGDFITVAAVQRRVNRRDDTKDVLEKVTLIRDIRFRSPHRAHLDILADLALARLGEKKPLTHFAELDRAWRRVLDSNELNKRFFRELANWFYWAAEHPGVSFPDVRDEPQPAEKRRKQHLQLIRLLTRLIFVWFLREKHLVPDKLFEETQLRALLKDFDPQGEGSSYYQAILQNLFFATLNTDMGDGRRFKDDAPSRYNAGYMIHTLYRYKSMFTDPDAALKLFASVPFLNGGLFECLDQAKDDELGIAGQRVDGFSDLPKNRATIPNALFFGRPTRADLNAAYGTRGKRYEVRGLLNILSSYKFTITENTPIEEEVALDPELLGKVFENLLAAHNPETEESARKETGSFYTPRDVVDFMVDESLLAYLAETLGADDDLSSRLRALLEYQSTAPAFTDDERARLIAALDGCTTLDPACGSGAFPLGVLQKLVHVLSQLDPGGARWKEQQEARLEADVRADPEVQALELDLQTIRGIQLAEARNKAEAEVIERLKERVQTLQDAFDPYLTEPDYARKLYLIENCIFGVDIQPIAVQIAKLRCFIALIVDQKVNDDRPNRGILPLPNLETKFVAANALYPLPQAQAIKPLEVYAREQELERIRHQHFKARKFSDKKRLRKRDADTRREIAAILKEVGFDTKAADQMANFDPYNQNASAPFFDPAWMFGLEGGFGVVIGNPPYIRQEKFKHDKPALKRHYDHPKTGVYTGTADLFVYFFRRGVDLLKPGGVLAYICSNKYFRSGYGKLLRDYLARQTRIRLLIDFGDAPVFTAIAYPSILLAQKALPNGNAMRVLSWNPKADIETFREVFEAESFEMPQRALTPDGWRIEGADVLKLLDKLRQAGTPLGDYVNGRFYRGILTGFNEAFVVGRAVRDALIQQDPKSAEVLKPFLRGRDVKRWRITDPDLWLIFTRRGVDIDQYPAIKKHLEQYKARLMPGAPGGRKPGPYEWYEIQDNIAYWQEFEQPKIVYPNICLRNEFAWDDQAYFSNQKTFIIPRASKYLIGILNSQVVNWLFQQLLPKLQNDYFEPSAIYFGKFPIPNASPATQALITRLVDYLLLLSAQPLAGSKDALMAPFFEQLLDALVFELYLPDALHGAGRRPYETLSAVAWPESPDVERLRALFAQLYDPQHPARRLVSFLDSIPEVRLILQGARQAVGAVVNDDE
jgi:hypothetical protein